MRWQVCSESVTELAPLGHPQFWGRSEPSWRRGARARQARTTMLLVILSCQVWAWSSQSIQR
jgi:hypothetical protein